MIPNFRLLARYLDIHTYLLLHWVSVNVWIEASVFLPLTRSSDSFLELDIRQRNRYQRLLLSVFIENRQQNCQFVCTSTVNLATSVRDGHYLYFTRVASNTCYCRCIDKNRFYIVITQSDTEWCGPQIVSQTLHYYWFSFILFHYFRSGLSYYFVLRMLSLEIYDAYFNCYWVNNTALLKKTACLVTWT